MSVLEAQHISKTIGNHTILKDVSLKIEKGEVLVLLGPSGSGKSTLLRTLNGLETIDHGNILLNNEALTLTEKSWEKVRPEVGMVFQSYDLWTNVKYLDTK